MKFLQPITLSDAMLVSSSIPEADHAAWVAGTTYAAGEKVIKGHRRWESAKASNVGHDPQGSDPTWWNDLGPTSRWAMFDRAVGTVAVGTNPITVVLNPGTPINALAFLFLVASWVRVEVTFNSSTIYDRTFGLADVRLNAGWFDYFFEPLARQTTLIVSDLPPVGTITITIAGTECGMLAVGRMYEVGKTAASPKVSLVDFSRKETDAYGVTTFVERGFSKKIECDVIVPFARAEAVDKKIAEIRAQPVIWIGGNGLDTGLLVIYGIAADWGIVVSYPHAGISDASLTIEGITA